MGRLNVERLMVKVMLLSYPLVVLTELGLHILITRRNTCINPYAPYYASLDLTLYSRQARRNAKVHEIRVRLVPAVATCQSR
jgi:hypothetical protein